MKKMSIAAVVLGMLFVPGVLFAAELDSDYDGLSDREEAKFFTDPMNPDTDGDGYPDGLEVQNGYSPHAGDGKKIGENDLDGDKLSDWVELWFGSSIGEVDTNKDGKSDYDAVMSGVSPMDSKRTFEKKIVVDLSLQRLYYYVDGIKMMNAPVSTGNWFTPTPVGKFEIQRKVENMRYVGSDYDFPGVKWNMQFKPRYYIHTAYWHNDFGERTRSHGCVNMRLEDAEELYKYADVGVSVETIGKTPGRYYVGT